MKWRSVRSGLLVLPVLLLLGFAIYTAWSGWNAVAGTEMGRHGVVAMVLGAIFTIGLAGVLVGLLLYSNRRGYDR